MVIGEILRFLLRVSRSGCLISSVNMRCSSSIVSIFRFLLIGFVIMLIGFFKCRVNLRCWRSCLS